MVYTSLGSWPHLNSRTTEHQASFLPDTATWMFPGYFTLNMSQTLTRLLMAFLGGSLVLSTMSHGSLLQRPFGGLSQNHVHCELLNLMPLRDLCSTSDFHHPCCHSPRSKLFQLSSDFFLLSLPTPSHSNSILCKFQNRTLLPPAL